MISFKMIPRKSIHSSFLILFVFCLTVDRGCLVESESNIPDSIFSIPSAVNISYSADQMCREYSQLIYTSMKNPILNTTNRIKDCVDTKTLIIGGTKTKPKEFPHMALMGVGETPGKWITGGSLISKRWILSGAISADRIRWARLGEHNKLAGSNDANYRILDNVVHPNYNKTLKYNDIALFRLEKDVIFSSYIRPVCLNTDQLLNPSVAIATGWGTIDFGGLPSNDLLKVNVDIFPINKCNSSFPPIWGLDHGIEDDSMVCAGSENGGKDTCAGDSGGPLQIVNSNYDCMYTQIGIVSFGYRCGTERPAVYTRVSKYISWIEPIVWPKTE